MTHSAASNIAAAPIGLLTAPMTLSGLRVLAHALRECLRRPGFSVTGTGGAQACEEQGGHVARS